ncbi:hypothetical protein FEM48_Zijuj10G0113600 [Ziziphus jujuba var. spinosa]|uniref:Expansin-like EG45 domain-containing protein n=1 Tax=Ziziphus jujuba var. spinosa TaxID=714518 RepID=A0A978UN32_ZIZJJ|nr:EG45-like domain containing protein [Ziziphus jujuba var. spinosa]KAH7516234.1 hypothetical protein FEM48_Zijuj10G0113600 [Ziziphus jujuba var. spinosa]
MAAAKSLVFMLIEVLIFFCFFSMSAVAATGTATYYSPLYTPSACYGYKNEGVMIAAASNAIWENDGACGRKYRVRCLSGKNKGVEKPCKPNQNVVVTIVDFCPPPGCHGTIYLSQEAFQSIADLDAGVINIDFQQL